MKHKISKKNLQSKYLKGLRGREKEFAFHPEEEDYRGRATTSTFTFTTYDESHYESHQFNSFKELKAFQKEIKQKSPLFWMDMAGINLDQLKEVCNYYQIHQLITEDIESFGQRAKVDDLEDQLFLLLPTLEYEKESEIIKIGQLFLLIREDSILSFHNTEKSPNLENVHKKLAVADGLARKKKSDYLLYLIFDEIVDNYYNVLDLLSDQLDKLEEIIIEPKQKTALLTLSILKHKILAVKRRVTPVREVINNLWQTDSSLIDPINKKYFKNIYDHVIIAVEYNDNYREIVISLQDLYMNQMNTRMNEVMKLLTIVTVLLAPFTVISGLYGMNFVRIPFSSIPYGFVIAVIAMIGISVLMLIYFKIKRWF